MRCTFCSFLFNLSGLSCLSDIFWMVPVQKVIEADLALILDEVVDCSMNILKNRVITVDGSKGLRLFHMRCYITSNL